MGDVLLFKRPRNGTIRGAARGALTEAMRTAGKKPVAVVIVVLSADGNYAMRSVSYDDIRDFDMYSRAGALMDKERLSLVD